MSKRLAAALVVALATVPVRSAEPEVRFTRPPTATRTSDGVRVDFAVSAMTDVTVAIRDGRGRIVRHLAAGVLGPNAPAPLNADALAQSIVWDRRGDNGRPAIGGPFSVRVQLAGRPRLDALLGFDGNTMSGAIDALTVGDNGELFVLLTDAFRGRSELRVLDRAGRYLRTIMPYAADTPADRLAGIGQLTLDGRRAPIVFNGQGHNLLPLTSGLRGQTMAWHPDGYLIAASATGSMVEQGPPRYLIALDPHGGAPAKVGFVGPMVRPASGFMGGSGEGSAAGMDRLAVSLDGQFIYFVQNIASKRFERERRHGVHRLRSSDKQLGPLWLGRDGPGDDQDAFNDPQGMAVDQSGRLFVCDRGNNRVKVYASADGKRLGSFAMESPQQIAVHPGSGEVFVLSVAAGQEGKLGTLHWLSAYDGRAAPRTRAQLEIKGAAVMAMDPTSKTPRLWIAATTGWMTPYRLMPVTAEDGTLKPGASVNRLGGLQYPGMLTADPARHRVIVRELLVKKKTERFVSIDLDSGNATPMAIEGTDLALDGQGNLIAMGGYNQHCLFRYDGDGKPLAFSGTGSPKSETLTFRAFGPDTGMRGHCVAPNGDIYVIRAVDKSVGANVDVVGPDGRIKKAGLIRGLGGGDGGIGVDAAGNVYVGINVKPADAPLPSDFAGQVPATPWLWWRKSDRTGPWAYPFCNPYLVHMGSVFKFGPAGGVLYGNQRPQQNQPIASPGTELANAPADAVAFKTAYLSGDVKIVGAQWHYAGIGMVPASTDGPKGDPGCVCIVSQLDVDPWGRVYAPGALRFAVEMLDANGNLITRIGRYGNADSGRSSRRIDEEPDGIPFAWPSDCDYAEADGRLYVCDSVNRRVVVVGFDHAATADAAVP